MTIIAKIPPSNQGSIEGAMTVEVESKILKQVEFYFGDANLPRDKFLLERVQENEGGCKIFGIM